MSCCLMIKQMKHVWTFGEEKWGRLDSGFPFVEPLDRPLSLGNWLMQDTIFGIGPCHSGRVREWSCKMTCHA